MTEIQLEENLSNVEQSIGQLLKERRESLSLSPADACSYLKVRKFDIDAVENNDLEKLSSHVYAVGFIRSYARFLKIETKIIEEKIKLLPIKSNTENKKHLLINIGEDSKFSPNREILFNSVLASIILLLIMLIIFNFLGTKNNLITSQILIHELESADIKHE